MPQDPYANASSRWANGYLRLRLIQELARGEKTHERLGEEFEVSPSTIGDFAKRYKREIEEAREDLSDVFAGLWVARKEARLAEYQQDIEDLTDAVELLEEPRSKLLRVKHTALRYVAEELGHLPGRVQLHVENAKVTYAVEGVDLSKLRSVAVDGVTLDDPD